MKTWTAWGGGLSMLALVVVGCAGASAAEENGASSDALRGGDCRDQAIRECSQNYTLCREGFNSACAKIGDCGSAQHDSSACCESHAEGVCSADTDRSADEER